MSIRTSPQGMAVKMEQTNNEQFELKQLTQIVIVSKLKVEGEKSPKKVTKI